MIATLVQVAKEMANYEGKKRGWDLEKVILHRLCESAIKGKDVPKVAVLDLTNQSVHLEDYRDEDRYKYLYALSTGKHAIGPSWLLDFRKAEGGRKGGRSTKKPKKSREEIIKVGIREVRGSIDNLIPSLEERIWDDLARKLDKATQNESSVLLTIVRDGKAPGDLEGFRQKFVRKKVLGERRAASGGKGNCAVCGEEKEVRSAIPFRFFTVEKQGFSPMGREEQVWKNAPVCEECAKWLYIAESYLQENLSTRVAGKSAYLMPDLEPGAANIEGSFVHYLWEWRERTKGKVAPEEQFPDVGNEKVEALPNLFEGLIEESDLRFKDNPPFRSASLVFYQPGQKFLFLYTISEILPISLRKAKYHLAGLRELLRQGALGDGGSKLALQLRADFGFVGQAWKWPHRGQSESEGILKITPMHLVEAILTDRRPSERGFWQDADSLLRAVYQEAISSKDQKPTLQSVLADRVRYIWALWALIYKSDKLEGGGSRMIHRELTEEFWEGFFQPRMLLDSPPKRAALLIGVLFGEVERKQRSERQTKAGEMPIISHLRGLTVSREEIMTRLFPELMLKLRQLDSNTRAIQAIQQAAADYTSQSGDLSDEEARFCFCLGWALSRATTQAVSKALGSPLGEEESEEALSEETTTDEEAENEL